MNRENSKASSRKERARRAQRTSRRLISGIVLALLIVLGCSTVSAYAKNQAYIEQENTLLAELEEEKARTLEIEEFKNYTQTDEYVEQIAREKLGLAYEEELIFQATE